MAWLRGWRGSNFGVGGLGGVGLQNFGVGQKNDVGGVGGVGPKNFGVGQKNGVGGVGRNFDMIGVNPNIGIVQKNGLSQNKME